MTQASPEKSNDESVGDSTKRRHLYLLTTLAVAAVLRIPSYFASRHLTFDDGVFASSVLAMREGGIPFKEVFSSQGPLFLPLVYLGDLIGLRSVDSPRVLTVVSGLAITGFVFAALARVTSIERALYGSLIAATSGSLLWVTGPLAADGPALAFAAAAFWLTLIYQRRPGHVTSLLIGLLVGASLSTKAMNIGLVAVVAVALGAPVFSGMRSDETGRFKIRSLVDPLIAGVGAVGIFLALSLPFGLSNVWDETFVYRTQTKYPRDPIGNARKMISTLWDRDLVLYALVLATIIWVLVHRQSDRTRSSKEDTGSAPQSWRPSPNLLSTIWLVGSFLWLAVGVSPMWRSHVSLLIVPAAFVLALNAPPLRWQRVLMVACVPLVVLQLHGLLWPGGYRGWDLRVVNELRNLPTGAWVLSDDPGLAWRAGHRTTDDLVDPSVLRVDSGRYDEDSVIDSAAEPQVCAVVVTSSERFGSFKTLGQRLEALGYRARAGPGENTDDLRRLYVRTDCSPPA